MSFVNLYNICISFIVSQLLYAIRLLSRFIYIYAFYSLFLGLSPAHTLICVTFISILYALYSLLGLSLAHTLICVTFVSIIYALYNLSGLSLANIHLLSGFFYAIWIYICFLQPLRVCL